MVWGSWYLSQTCMCLLISVLGSRYSESTHFVTKCQSDFKQYGDQSCFKLFNYSSSFQQGSVYCQNYTGKLLTISDTWEYNRASTYIKLYGNSESYWIGLMYQNNSEGDPVLTDVDGNIVNASMFGLELVEPTIGDCIHMNYSDGGPKFMKDNCSNMHNVICLTEWPGVYMIPFH